MKSGVSATFGEFLHGAQSAVVVIGSATAATGD